MTEMALSTRWIVALALAVAAAVTPVIAVALTEWWDRRMERLSGYNRDTFRARRDDDEPRLKKIYGIRKESYPNAR